MDEKLLEEFRTEIRRRLAERLSRRSKPLKHPPRYDEVFFRGLEELAKWEDQSSSYSFSSLNPDGSERDAAVDTRETPSSSP